MKKILQIENLTVSFPLKRDLLGRVKEKVTALNKIDLEVLEGETMGVVGESGCGKTTLAKTIVGLNDIEKGSIIFDEKHKIHKFQKHDDWKDVRKDIQFIFQDPVSSLDPMVQVEDALFEPLDIFYPQVSYERKEEMIQEMIKKVGLNEVVLYRYPHELSGGQCQRVGIARALITKPKLLICDESISALDLSVQAQVLNLLKRLQKEMNLSMIFITHNLSVVRYIADKITVMYLGKIVEQAPSQDIFAHQCHPYTKALFDSIAPLHPSEDFFTKETLEGEIPSVSNPPSGCPFRTRCKFCTSRCIDEAPELETLEEQDRSVSCHFKLEEQEEN